MGGATEGATVTSRQGTVAEGFPGGALDGATVPITVVDAAVPVTSRLDGVAEGFPGGASDGAAVPITVAVGLRLEQSLEPL